MLELKCVGTLPNRSSFSSWLSLLLNEEFILGEDDMLGDWEYCDMVSRWRQMMEAEESCEGRMIVCDPQHSISFQAHITTDLAARKPMNDKHNNSPKTTAAQKKCRQQQASLLQAAPGATPRMRAKARTAMPRRRRTNSWQTCCGGQERI